MKLYANGCSFTQGHSILNPDCPRNPVDYKNNDYSYHAFYTHDITWPHQLSTEFEYMFNHALGGSGIMRMVRTTLEFLASVPDNEVDDWVIVLQASCYNRFEVVGGESGDYFMSVNLSHDRDAPHQPGKDVVEVYTNDPHETMMKDPEHIKLSTSNAEIKQVLTDYVNFARPEKQMLYTQLKELYIVVNELERRNFKYLITGMHTDFYDVRAFLTGKSNNNIKSSASLNVAKLIPVHNFIDGIEVINSDKLYRHSDIHDTCGHPNKIGHKLIADYILDEINKRGYLD